MKKSDRNISILLFGVLALGLGAICGAIIWVILKIIAIFTEVIWTFIPQGLGVAGPMQLVYNLVVCLIGAVLIAILISRHGFLPDSTEQVMEKLKKNGSYPYGNIKLLALAAILPLIFGGVLGPEAGLVGIIVGLCCWVGDILKNRGDKLVKLLGKEETQTLGEVGISTVLSVVFMAPLVGVVNNLEQGKSKKPRKRVLTKLQRTLIYCCGVLGGLLTFTGLGALLSVIVGDGVMAFLVEESGLPRFDASLFIDPGQWIWAIVIIAVGLILGFIYQSVNKGTLKIADTIKTKFQKTKKGSIRFSCALLLCSIAAICVAICGYIWPETMFSGEHQLVPLMESWSSYDSVSLAIIAIIKISLVSLCINFGWRGGSIFPIIFSGCALGFALALLLGVDGAFAAALAVGAAYGYIARKPLTVAAILLLCFPITYIIPILLAAFVASKIPSPFIKEAEASI